MGRVLVVSRNPGVSMGLSSTDHDVVDISPADLDAWIDRASSESLDGVVLDLTDAEQAVRAITELRAHAQMAPVLVIPGDGPGWEDSRMRELPAAAVLPRPVTKPSLQDAVDRLVARGTESLLMSPVVAAPVPGVDGSVDGSADHLPHDDLTELDAPAADGSAAEEDEVGDATVSTLLDRLTAAPSVVHPPLEPPVRPAVTSGARHATRSAAPPMPSSSELMPPTPARPRAIELVRSLLAVTDDLYGANETSQAIVIDALERTGAEAAAVMLPDGARWRVAAGIGLRALEHRYELTEHDWLVVEVAQGRRSVVMEDTDIARQPLRGSPLASWHHLVATPIPIVSGVLLVARSDDPAFTQGDVESLGALSAEAAPLVAASLDVRLLSRRLDHLRDHSDPSAPTL